MNINGMTIQEKNYINEVLDELKRYHISSNDRKKVKQQLMEHIQVSREHGLDGIGELGDIETFVKDYMEINEIDLHSHIKSIQTSKIETRRPIVIALLASMAAYLISQLIFSLFLTESFSPLRSSDYDYNILYRVTEHSWWNVLLILTSLTISLFAGSLILFLHKRKLRQAGG
ncbi:hypothetical protein [Rossellomorea sp. NS-SX7]|uniref:hypothetical protein n=1 Tax=Rossellomorea sp. NS-SX7 TaxID=3463856 RepID=UPI00405854F3